jgi:microcystin-dependent protein
MNINHGMISEIRMTAGATPDGWLICAGQAISRTVYSDLFASIGVSYGSGDGSTTFNIPDLRGRTPIGAGAGPGLSSRIIGQSIGFETHTLNSSELGAHAHGGVATGSFSQQSAGGVGISFLTALTIGNSADAGGNQPHNNMQPSLVVNYIIKY